MIKYLFKITLGLALVAGTAPAAIASATQNSTEAFRAPHNSKHIRTVYNPQTKELVINVHSKSKEFAKFYITDQRGVVYINETIMFTGNRQVINMPLNSLATGGYHVKIVSKSITYSSVIKKY